MVRCLKKCCRIYAHPYCLQQDRKPYVLAFLKEEDNYDFMKGWELEFRLQDYTKAHYVSQLAGDLTPMIKNSEFFGEDLKLRTPKKGESEEEEGK